MKQPISQEGMVDKREKLMFEIYKDKVLINFNALKKEIKRDYGFEPNYILYREIINYQVKKYGASLMKSVVSNRDYTKYIKSSKTRNKHNELMRRNYIEKAHIEKIERLKNASK